MRQRFASLVLAVNNIDEVQVGTIFILTAYRITNGNVGIDYTQFRFSTFGGLVVLSEEPM